MKKFLLTFLAAVAFGINGYSQDSDSDTLDLNSYFTIIDSIERSFTYQHGIIDLENGVGKIKVPDGYKYLDAAQSTKVLVDLWGNPPGEGATLGMIIPESQGVMADSGYVFNIQYDEIGYVKDDDAGDINYDELLEQMQTEEVEDNKDRVKEGYEPVHMVGWAAHPFYDKDRKILHWAKELKFGSSDVNTLNYNVRVLGRKGVLILNAITSMPNLPLVQNDLNKVLNIVEFNDGHRYKDFDPSVDKIAAWTIGGLVAGKILAKAGILAVILKFWKIIALAVAGAGGALWKKLRGKNE